MSQSPAEEVNIEQIIYTKYNRILLLERCQQASAKSANIPLAYHRKEILALTA